MPEQQASPTTTSEPSSTAQPSSQQQDDAPSPLPPESSKRTYLSLLPPPQLIDLVLAIDANRETVIFPHDLDSAIKALQRPRQSQSPRATATTVVVKPEAASTPAASTSTPPPPPPPQQNNKPQVQAQSPVVQPPQYKPPVYKQPPHPQQVYPYAHTPYYPQPLPLQPQVHVSPPPPPPAPPTRHPLFTSTPLTRDPNRPPMPRPPPPPLVSSRDDPNAMPSYEEMIVEAIMDVGDADGTAPKTLFSWMASHYPLQQNFRPSASQALHKALKRGRLEKIGGKYRLDPSWGGGPTTSKRATRRPTANRAGTPPLSRPPHASGFPPNAIPPPGYGHPHAPYGYAPYPHHPSLQLHPYGPAYDPNGAVWIAGHPRPLPQAVHGDDSSGKADGMDVEEGNDSDDAENPAAGEREVVDVGDENEEIRQSLLRLVRVLRRFASKEEGSDANMQE